MITKEMLIGLGSGRRLNIPNMVKATQIPASKRLYKSIQKFSELPQYKGHVCG